jgi:hypothetical protein
MERILFILMMILLGICLLLNTAILSVMRDINDLNNRITLIEKNQP